MSLYDFNCRSLLYWGARSSLVLPQTPWSSFSQDLTSWLFLPPSFFSTAKLFFCLQQKPTSYALFPPQTPYLLPAPSTSSMQSLMKLPLCRTRVTHTAFSTNQPPETARRLWLQIYLTIKSSSFFFFFFFFSRLDTSFSWWGRFVLPIRGDVFIILPAPCYTVSIRSSLSCRQPVGLPQFCSG